MGYKINKSGKEIESLLRNGVPIVDDVAKLEALNADLGAVAVVATESSGEEKSIIDLYQPTFDDLDLTTYTFNTENFSKVSGISFTPPTGLEGGIQTMVYFCTEDVSLAGDSGGTIVAIASVVEDGVITGIAGMALSASDGTPQEFQLYEISNGVTITHQDQIDALNDILSSEQFYYLGFFEQMMGGVPPTEDDFATIDKIMKVVNGVPTTAKIFIKEDVWVGVSIKELSKLANRIESVNTSLNNALDSKVDPIPIKTEIGYKGLQPNEYTITTFSNYSRYTITIAPPLDTNVYNEYILEIKCLSTPYEVIFKDKSSGSEYPIVWANGEAPQFEEGFTYIISIANGFGVFCKFKNSDSQ